MRSIIDHAANEAGNGRKPAKPATIRPVGQPGGGAVKLYRHVINTLRQEIASGVFEAGARLPSERVLVDRFAVSRLTIREALIGMEILGLIEARQGSGFFVTGAAGPPQVNPDALDIGAFELTEARRIVEVQAAALAALAATDEQIVAMREILEQMDVENRSARQDEWSADRQFHLMIAQASQNSAVALMVETLWDVRTRSPLCHAMLQRITDAGETPRMTDHRLILDAIEGRDPAGARNAMLKHLDRVLANLINFTESDAIEQLAVENARRREVAKRRLKV
ncbi:FadR/GntR family transcriptional regulator [Sphingomonas sp. CFBP 8760]|uniref:FadR/GntR family transcriptional regulator n=1 Tax=Sphingomonas sp. CFBP 8760 TaxID=2775282 RepID=UPI0017802893|nr:FadR/GntR family transcriptional regulator [Sphingomonas sp. CFBP 8760]MBD8548938.1 FadR family transcriptional regulator [Sphingomonas sp. CFBP 8760]